MNTAEAYDEAAYLREALKKERALRQAEIQRCGRAEGALAEVERQLGATRTYVTQLCGQLEELRKQLRAERDAS